MSGITVRIWPTARCSVRSMSACEQPFEVAEVRVDDRARDLGVARDAVDRDGAVALGEDDRREDVEELVAALLG